MITLPVVWFFFPSLGLSLAVTTILSEIFALLFEAFFLHLVSRPKISLKHAFMLSLLMNAASFLIGLASSALL
jgi:hypothetical protein